MPDFNAKILNAPKSISALGELTALLQTPWLDLRGPTSKGRGREGTGGQGRGGDGKGRQGRGA